ncbi:hypothetical protein SERLA73DRAFT_181230 [Serpula lacrymans var. lacrymans S7.3]|uniref:Enoyl reductase (ER) domain-containing protein n=2 Tax=Serpula lacrymans var. lacrymans TaxID=341189 RepID=F8PXP7_SERL3|nr:uncharacterized protein SERLADRAFT_467281 [Serpula lacrymans var. lacrymans S7.9]EGN98660.1 hypothetical protein SERLA73DRAFT_181230 [Serpula lacrymans var. lacrymans S7.3]EGO24264.1 hypothetical protein SERLADRAFT_467281 [Serpula lacrymans var. lacrymans S7.9]
MGFDFTVFKGSKDGKITKSTTHKDTLDPDEVLIQVTHSGLCGTDQHYRSEEMVLGHEGVGIVQQIGSTVTSFKVGERVGWGYEHDSCGHCDECLNGNEMHCPERHMYGISEFDQGSFATHAVWRARFLFHVPESIQSAEAAPLMCAGATVFNALYSHDVRPTDRVGIVGIGGLGHLAIQFASRMGCEVVVFSGTESKKQEAMHLGASEFYATKDVKKLDIGRKLKHLFVTTSSQPDWPLFFSVLAPNAAIYPLTVSQDSLTMPYLELVQNGIRIQGSITPSRGTHIKMLRFAAFHQIKPIVQTFPMNLEGIEDAMQKLEKGEVRYRAVLVVEGA